MSFQNSGSEKCQEGVRFYYGKSIWLLYPKIMIRYW